MEKARGHSELNATRRRSDEDVAANSVQPEFPVTIQQTIRDVRLDLVAGDFFGAALVTGVVLAFGINVGEERQPFAVRRPDGLARAARQGADLLQRAAGNINGPNLIVAITRGDKGELLSVRRPARRRG